jgi:hypothetical protein
MKPAGGALCIVPLSPAFEPLTHGSFAHPPRVTARVSGQGQAIICAREAGLGQDRLTGLAARCDHPLSEIRWERQRVVA